MAPDVVFVGDGGGIAPAPRHPIHGAEAVAKFLIGLGKTAVAATAVAALAEINGAPAVVIRVDGAPLSVFTLDVQDTRIAAIHAVANPAKLGRLRPGRSVT